MRLLPAFLLAASSLMLSTGLQAAGDPADRVDAHYESAKKRCDALSGNDRDVCIERAKANKTEAETKMESEYEVAKEKCDALQGDAKDRCIDKAKATYGQ